MHELLAFSSLVICIKAHAVIIISLEQLNTLGRLSILVYSAQGHGCWFRRIVIHGLFEPFMELLFGIAEQIFVRELVFAVFVTIIREAHGCFRNGVVNLVGVS